MHIRVLERYIVLCLFSCGLIALPCDPECSISEWESSAHFEITK